MITIQVFLEPIPHKIENITRKVQSKKPRTSKKTAKPKRAPTVTIRDLQFPELTHEGIFPSSFCVIVCSKRTNVKIIKRMVSIKGNNPGPGDERLPNENFLVSSNVAQEKTSKIATANKFLFFM